MLARNRDGSRVSWNDMRRSASRVVVLGSVAVGLFGCGKNEDVFADRVLPIVERRCANAACHGSDAGPGGAAHQLDPSRWLTFKIGEGGKIVDRAGALASIKAKISAEKPEFSSFLRKAIPVALGGQHHFQSAVFQSRDDADYKALEAWVRTVTDGTEGASEPPLDEREQRFATAVYPSLIDLGCATASCHGSLMFGGALFHAPALPGTKELPRAELRATYREARRNLTFWGDPRRSRLITKVIPLAEGGIPHKGGNDAFVTGGTESLVDKILAWAELERRAETGSDAPFVAEPTIVFVGGPLSPARPFEVPRFTPGTDLYVLDPPYTGAPRNLTAAAHTAPADIRDPAVSHDGKTVVFTMRTSAEDAHNLYTIGLDGTGLRQLTSDRATAESGLAVGNFAPVFGPNGGFTPAGGAAPAERIYFSSTRAGDLSDLASVQNADLYVVDPDGGNLERLTYTIVPEVTPSFLTAGEFSGTMVYTIKRSAEGGYKGVLFRFPIDHNVDHHVQPEAHPHFGMSEPPQVFYGLKELPDGRAALALVDEANVWRGGQLAVLERQFAVEIEEGRESSATLPAFRHALTILSPDAARAGQSAGGLWRDPAPLPDGGLLVAHAPEALDLASAAAAPRPRLVRLRLRSDGATQRPAIAGQETLFDDAALPASQPVAVFARPAEDPPHPRRWDDTSATAMLLHSGVQVIEAVLASLSPVKPRTAREDLALVRAVVPVSIAGKLDTTPVPAAETRHGLAGATKTSLTQQMPLFAAVEVPPAADGSLAANIPAKVPVRVVTLDADGIAIGALQHHWYAALPGERFPVGIPLTSYNARCGGCHGAFDGNPNTVLAPPTDFVTQASVTAAVYKDRDRRVPNELPTIGPSFFKFADFRTHVQPILEQKCVSCHGATNPAGGVTLTSTPTRHYTDAYETLLEPGEGSASGFRWVDARGLRGRASHLVERIWGREYDAPRELTGVCPPADAPQLSVEEKQTITRWIELGAAFVGVPGM